jgi:hypothetical protein
MMPIYEKFTKEAPWVYARIKLTFKESEMILEDSLAFKNAIFMALKHGFGISGQAIHVDIVDYEPEKVSGIVRVPSE